MQKLMVDRKLTGIPGSLRVLWVSDWEDGTSGTADCGTSDSDARLPDELGEMQELWTIS